MGYKIGVALLCLVMHSVATGDVKPRYRCAIFLSDAQMANEIKMRFHSAVSLSSAYAMALKLGLGCELRNNVLILHRISGPKSWVVRVRKFLELLSCLQEGTRHDLLDGRMVEVKRFGSDAYHSFVRLLEVCGVDAKTLDDAKVAIYTRYTLAIHLKSKRARWASLVILDRCIGRYEGSSASFKGDANQLNIAGGYTPKSPLHLSAPLIEIPCPAGWRNASIQLRSNCVSLREIVRELSKATGKEIVIYRGADRGSLLLPKVRWNGSDLFRITCFAARLYPREVGKLILLEPWEGGRAVVGSARGLLNLLAVDTARVMIRYMGNLITKEQLERWTIPFSPQDWLNLKEFMFSKLPATVQSELTPAILNVKPFNFDINAALISEPDDLLLTLIPGFELHLIYHHNNLLTVRCIPLTCWSEEGHSAVLSFAKSSGMLDVLGIAELVMTQATYDSNARLRETVAQALTYAPLPWWRHHLITLLSDEDPSTAHSAVLAGVKLRLPEAVAMAAKKIAERRSHGLIGRIEYLAHIGDTAGVKELANRALKSDDSRVRIAMIKAIAHLQLGQFRERLRHIIEADPVREVRATARCALWDLLPNGWKSEELLSPLLESSDERERILAMDCIVRDMSIYYLPQRGWQVRYLQRALHDPNPTVRGMAVVALCRGFYVSQVPLIVKCFKRWQSKAKVWAAAGLVWLYDNLDETVLSWDLLQVLTQEAYEAGAKAFEIAIQRNEVILGVPHYVLGALATPHSVARAYAIKHNITKELERWALDVL
ncbi:MAG TPA: hypothetical protein EYP10_04670, partial [Armatimonadetes bacterium]|nr:hypothetical protein [Armatimonadota bacterium]